MTGPLHGTRVLEIGGIGPSPYAGMILADMGAEVIRIDRPGAGLPFPLAPEHVLVHRGKRQVTLDLKDPRAIEALLKLVETADVLYEGNRPGVAERLGFGPDVCLERNPRLVYGRMTGWGQDGPWAHLSGHDITYVAATGALHAIGEAGGPPQVPLNLLGDYGGGATFLVMGVLAALLEARSTGRGQVVDASIVDGVSHLMGTVHMLMRGNLWQDTRGANILDGGAPFYGVYATSDGRHVAVGAIEPQFWAELVEKLDLQDAGVDNHFDQRTWPHTREVLEAAFGAQPLAHWAEVFADSDACVTPIVSIEEAIDHPQLQARGAVRRTATGLEPAPAPRFSGTPDATPGSTRLPGVDTREVLESAGIDVDALVADGIAVEG